MDKKRKGCALQSAQSYDFFVGVDACAMLLLLRRGRCPHRPNGNCGFALDFRKNGSHRRGDVLNRPLRTPRKGLPVSRWNSPNKKDTPVPCIGTRVPEYFVVPPKFEELALPRMPRSRGGDRRFRDFPYTPARRMSFAHAGRRNLSACDFLSVRPPCGTASASLRFCIIQMNALSGASWP